MHFKSPPRPLDWRTGTSHSSRDGFPRPPPCLPVLPNEDKWVHSPAIPGITLYLAVVPYKAGPPCCPSYPSNGCPPFSAIAPAPWLRGGNKKERKRKVSVVPSTCYTDHVRQQLLWWKQGWEGSERECLTKRIQVRMFFDLFFFFQVNQEKSSLK